MVARQLARKTLSRIRRDSAYANLVLDSALERERGLSSADRGLVTELVYGVLRQRRQLDYQLQGALRKPIAKTDPELLDLLRVGAYQLLFLDRVPAYAAVDAAVNEARKLRGGKASGFVNAVLRKIARKGRQALVDPRDDLAVGASLPDWLAELLVADLAQQEALGLARALLQPAALCLRANRLRGERGPLEEILTAEGAKIERCQHAPDGLRVKGLSSPFRSESFGRGLWTVQDEAAQLVALLLQPRDGDVVFDACAGVGGKTTYLAELVGRDGRVIAADINQTKLDILEEHCARLGTSCERQLCDLARSASDEIARCSHVLLDAPCSGLGVLRRHPELKWREPPRLAELVALQRTLLGNVVEQLQPGAVLVYSVCTFSKAEGLEQVDWLLSRFARLALEPPAEQSIVDWTALAPSGVLQLWPHRHGTDGFFAARFRVKG
jgi:16S rRNA (cytosine967-C5)-methyltransferase